jgi:acyl carrier protein
MQPEALVLRVVRELVGEDSGARIEAGTPLMEAGIDSLTATELVQQLRDATGLALLRTLVLERPTPRALAAHLTSRLVGAVSAVGPAECASAPARQGLMQDVVKVRSVAGRWPGGEYSARGILQASGDAVGEVPAARWVLETAVDVRALSEVQARCVAHGGFVADADGFDARCFGVSSAEAATMDPQQRLLLEAGYEALHGGGKQKPSLLGSSGGVWVGIELGVAAGLCCRAASVRVCRDGRLAVGGGRAAVVRSGVARVMRERRHGVLVGARRSARRVGCFASGRVW